MTLTKVITRPSDETLDQIVVGIGAAALEIAPYLPLWLDTARLRGVATQTDRRALRLAANGGRNDLQQRTRGEDCDERTHTAPPDLSRRAHLAQRRLERLRNGTVHEHGTHVLVHELAGFGRPQLLEQEFEFLLERRGVAVARLGGQVEEPLLERSVGLLAGLVVELLGGHAFLALVGAVLVEPGVHVPL